MCGICGICYFDKQHEVDPALLQAMTNIIQHRGPDDEGHHIEGSVGLGSRRLSIVGLGDGHMPMCSEDGALWIVYNGELYNHPELKKELQGKGYTYRTQSDTETFLHLYREYGERFLEKTRGMFAVALWDRNEQKLILSRDRLGIKPLYYQLDQSGLRFGSEIKSILCDPDVPRAIDLRALNFFLGFLSAPAPHTMFRNIYQLMPGEMLILQEGKTRYRTYWDPAETIQQNRARPVNEMVEELQDRMRLTVREHMLSDVPVGAFLSGGIDSSVLVALMHEFLGPGFKTFAIGFEGHKLFDETPHAEEVARLYQTDHYQQKLKPNDLLKALDDITWQLDDPLADSSCLPLYFVSKLAAEHVKVVLSGDGGDEVFAGYRKYQGEYFRKFFSWVPDHAMRFMTKRVEKNLPESRSGYWMDMSRQVKKFFRGFDPSAFERNLGWAIHFEDQTRESLFQSEVLRQIDFDAPRRYRQRLFNELKNVDELTRMLWVDLRHNLPADMLCKVDRMSMLHSLEVRVPFLDHTLVEFAFSLPDVVKLRGKSSKWILKEAFKNKLPKSIVHRRKHGFDVPVGEWFRHELRDVIEDVCSEETTKRRGLFDPRRVRQIMMDHQDGKRDNNNQLWILLSLEIWQRTYLDHPHGLVPRPSVSWE